MNRPLRSRPRVRGATLIEALLAVFVVAVAMVGAAQGLRPIRLHADAAAERSVAVRLAQDEIERLRSTADLHALADEARDVAAGGAATRLVVRRRFADSGFGSRDVTVEVDWTDRAGSPQRLALHTTVRAPEPWPAGAAMLAPPGTPLAGAWSRSVHLPPAAVDLGDGRSTWQPPGAATETWLLDNRSAAVLAVCTATGCAANPGLLLSGVVRFADSDAPDPAAANDAPLDTAVTIAPAGPAFAAAPHCVAGPRVAGGERALHYACVVTPGAAGAWSGRVLLQPLGWSIGIGAGERRVCRYSADSDGTGAVDSAHEHPVDHAGVAGALPHQNFLVVRGDRPCPAAPAAILWPVPNGVFSDRSTVAHQS